MKLFRRLLGKLANPLILVEEPAPDPRDIAADMAAFYLFETAI